MEPRWRRAVNFTTAALGEEVGKIYVAQYFSPETKGAALDVVHNIMAAMGLRIDQLSWMRAEAKAKAHEKLADFTPTIGYADKWRDYSWMEIRRHHLLGTPLRSRTFENEYEIDSMG